MLFSSTPVPASGTRQIAASDADQNDDIAAMSTFTTTISPAHGRRALSRSESFPEMAESVGASSPLPAKFHRRCISDNPPHRPSHRHDHQPDEEEDDEPVGYITEDGDVEFRGFLVSAG
jgi:hypothetical protein